MAEPHSDFWRATWAAWRAGVVSSLETHAQILAACNFDEFLAKRTDSPVNTFLDAHPALLGEFLVSDWIKKKRIDFLITNKRLWVRKRKSAESAEYECLGLADIASMVTKSGWSSFSLVVYFNDGKRQTLSNLAVAPNDYTTAKAITICNTPEYWSTTAPTLVVSHDPTPSSETVPNVAPAITCSRCQATVAADSPTAQQWALFRTTDVKTKYSELVGFPGGGKLSVTGMRIELCDSFQTAFCSKCLKDLANEFAQSAASTYREYWVGGAIGTLLCLVCGALVVSFRSAIDSTWRMLLGLWMPALGLLALGYFTYGKVMARRLTKVSSEDRPGWQTYVRRAHSLLAAEYCAAKVGCQGAGHIQPREWNSEPQFWEAPRMADLAQGETIAFRGEDSHPGSGRTGGLVLMTGAPSVWMAKFHERETRTGWSWFECFADFGNGNGQFWDSDMTLQKLRTSGVTHLGEYLAK